MKMKLVVLFFIMITGIVAVPVIKSTAMEKPLDYDCSKFGHGFLDVVEYEKDWWEITARLEQEHMVDGNVYRWYRLTRPFEGEIEHKWVWAGYIDKPEKKRSVSISSSGECCGTPPPPCPDPPGDPC